MTHYHNFKKYIFYFIKSYKYTNIITYFLDLQPLFLTNAKGSKILMIDGHRYRRNGTGDTFKIRWRCTSHAKYGCKAVVHTINDEIVYYMNVHTTHFDHTAN